MVEQGRNQISSCPRLLFTSTLSYIIPTSLCQVYNRAML
uniref:Uncharacterized protein n=1 Tax=Siphoviridae sp. ctqSm5 TaxID=2827949 RepID=A0A8S5SP34_9CAUD|nr:MAG TPA: hypothetical protein [Siphoviridae sp. ctqSm5]